MYKKVTTDMNFVAREKEVLSFWKEHDIVKKSFHARDNAKETFTFFDGPPTANGKPHIGHVETRAIKDLIPRFQTMKGYSVLRKAGWDTHGLPVELEVEKKLGLDGKPQIEKYGIEPFIQQCKESVWKYLHEWEEMSDRVAFWADMDDPYVTYHDNYIESVWWSLKTIAEKGLIYKGHKIVPYCPRCGTALSSHEVAQGYKAVKEFSAFAKFKVKNAETLTYILAWTTTPWTLPSNVALCVNANEEYCEFKWGGAHNIMAKALIPSVFSEEDQKEIEILRTFKGAELEHTEYEPLFPLKNLPKEKAWYVVCDDYVTLTDGTGVVHIAPAFGEDDARVGRNYNLPFVQLVDTQGRFVEDTPWAGTFVKEADEPIMQDLKARGLLLKKALYEHEYPFCWRCDTPLLYYARPTWFIKMTAVRDELVANNRSVNWYPDNIKEGRMGNFLENVVDWGLSRERYWGTPLPIWLCEDGHMHVIGSKQELKDMAIGEVNLPELHRPYIDEVVIKCPHCGKPMHRTKEVIDCWYDSGSMPFAQWHYPFENKEKFEARFPANFISEAIDQTRGWFYTLLAISTLIFGRAPFKNCVVMGHVQDKDGRKMSKHLGNVVDPKVVLDKQGADAIRWFFYSSSAPWLPCRFHEDALNEGPRKFMTTLWNTYYFYILYADIDQFDPTKHDLSKMELTLMDKWVLSRLNTVIKGVDEDLNAYRIPESTRKLSDFVDELSNWYVRLNRDRFWGKGMAGDKEAAFMTLYTVLSSLVKVVAPYLPFISESIYQNVVRSVDETAPESVHLCDYPVCDESMIDADVEAQMAAVETVVQLGRSCRNLSNMKVRQPLSTLYVSGADFGEAYKSLVEDELNVKNVQFIENAGEFVSYDLKPNFFTLKTRYGRFLGKMRGELQKLDGNAVVAAFDKGETYTLVIDGTEIILNKEDILVEAVKKEGYTSQVEGKLTVVLDTNLNDALIQEGFAREVISKLQTMRKDAGFDVTDRITVTCQGDDEVVAAVKAFQGMIENGVLATAIGYDAAPEGAVSQEWDINGKKATLSVKR
ncbi:MAG: isoleucine--tRNA ligase [Clostridiales bacterium]|nr:isoleucine--tRNA ligase [Clostridiales bacterium]